jgi:ParB family transcriptional regulator, chromosome partitioning protein
MSKVKSVLGKGLSALIPAAAEDQREEERRFQGRVQVEAKPDVAIGQGVADIEIARIAPNPLQPRKEFPTEALEELTQSIREHGVIQAITVRRAEGDHNRFELVSGERRVRAAIEAGLTHVPAYILDVDSDRKMLELAIIENVQRLQFNPIEEAEAYQRLITECGLTQDDVAEKISKDRTSISNSLRLLKLPEQIKQSLRIGELGAGHAKAILSVPDSNRQVALWQEAVREKTSVRKLEELARREQQTNAPKNAPKPKQKESATAEPPIAEVKKLEDKIQHVLGTQVRIKLLRDGSGEMNIQFYSHDDLERVTELLLGIEGS